MVESVLGILVALNLFSYDSKGLPSGREGVILKVKALFGEASPCQLGVGQTQVVILRLVSGNEALVPGNVEVLLGCGSSLQD